MDDEFVRVAHPRVGSVLHFVVFEPFENLDEVVVVDIALVGVGQVYLLYSVLVIEE